MEAMEVSLNCAQDSRSTLAIGPGELGAAFVQFDWSAPARLGGWWSCAGYNWSREGLAAIRSCGKG
jgi:hypothetical protein